MEQLDEGQCACASCGAINTVPEDSSTACVGCKVEIDSEGRILTLCERCSEFKLNVGGREKQLNDGSFMALRNEEQKCDECWSHDDGSDEYEDPDY